MRLTRLAQSGTRYHELWTLVYAIKGYLQTRARVYLFNDFIYLILENIEFCVQTFYASYFCDDALVQVPSRDVVFRNRADLIQGNAPVIRRQGVNHHRINIRLQRQRNETNKEIDGSILLEKPLMDHLLCSRFAVL